MIRDWFDINDMDQYTENHPRFFELTGCTLDTSLGDLNDAVKDYVLHRHFDPRLIKDKYPDKTNRTKLDPSFDFWSHHYKLMVNFNNLNFEDTPEPKETTMNTEQLQERQCYQELLREAGRKFLFTVIPDPEFSTKDVMVYDTKYFNDKLDNLVQFNTGLSKTSNGFATYRKDILTILNTEYTFQLKDIEDERFRKVSLFQDAFLKILEKNSYTGALDLHQQLNLRGIEHDFVVLKYSGLVKSKNYKTFSICSNDDIVIASKTQVNYKAHDNILCLYESTRIEKPSDEVVKQFGFLDRYFASNTINGMQSEGITFWIGNFMPEFIE